MCCFAILPFLAILVIIILAFASSYVASYESSEIKKESYSLRLWHGFQLITGNFGNVEKGPQYLAFSLLLMLSGVVLLTMLVGVLVRA